MEIARAVLCRTVSQVGPNAFKFEEPVGVVQVRSLPSKQQLAVLADWQKAATDDLVPIFIRIVDGRGQPIVKGVRVDIELAPEMGPSANGTIAWQFDEITFRKAGEYSLQVIIEDEVRWMIRFLILLTPGPGGNPQRPELQ
jgi:hypothetical protein